MTASRFLPRAAAAMLALPLLAGSIGVADAQLFRRSPPESVASDHNTTVRIDQLESQVRSLTGQVEQYEHRIRQLEDQLRRFQEDVEYRFQESNGGAPAPRRTARGEPQPRQETAPRQFDPPRRSNAPGQPETYGGIRNLGAPGQGGQQGGDDFSSSGRFGGGNQPLNINPNSGGGFQPPANVGRFDDVRGGGGGNSGFNDRQGNAGQVALAVPDDPQTAYDVAYAFILQRDYEAAQSAFAQFLQKYPGDKLAGNAQYWLGESHYAQGRYREAADAFLTGYQQYAGGGKGPDSLLKLAMSLEALGQKEAACASFDEFGRKFPDATDSMKKRVSQERKSAGC